MSADRIGLRIGLSIRRVAARLGCLPTAERLARRILNRWDTRP